VVTFNAVGFEITGGPDPNPGALVFPPIASYRWTISDIEVRRVFARGFGSSGGDKPPESSAEERSADGGAETSLLDFEGKTNMDWGRERPDTGDLGPPDDGCLRCWLEPVVGRRLLRPESRGEDSADWGDADLGFDFVEDNGKIADRRFWPFIVASALWEAVAETALARIGSRSFSLGPATAPTPPPHKSTKSWTELCLPFLLVLLVSSFSLAVAGVYPLASSGPSSALDGDSTSFCFAEIPVFMAIGLQLSVKASEGSFCIAEAVSILTGGKTRAALDTDVIEDVVTVDFADGDGGGWGEGTRSCWATIASCIGTWFLSMNDARLLGESRSTGALDELETDVDADIEG
jgi:hypothetical protein